MPNELLRIRLDEIADALDRAERYGRAVDRPEGVRYIRISDTLAIQVAEYLREASEALQGEKREVVQ